MLYFSIQNASPRWDESGHRSGLCEMAILSSDYLHRLSSECHRIVFILAEAIQGFLAQILTRQAHSLVSLKGDFTCSAHCKWRFICDADQSWVMRVIFRGRRSIWWSWRMTPVAPLIVNDCFICDADQSWVMRFTLRGRCNICWSWRLTFQVTFHMWCGSIMGHESHLSWQAQYLAKLEDDSCCPAQCK